MKHTEIPAVKVWSDVNGAKRHQLDTRWMYWRKTKDTTIPCILRTAAAFRKAELQLRLIITPGTVVQQTYQITRHQWEQIDRLLNPSSDATTKSADSGRGG